MLKKNIISRYELKLLVNMIVGFILFALFYNHILNLYGVLGKIGMTVSVLLIGAGAIKYSQEDQYGKKGTEEERLFFYLISFGLGWGIIALFLLKAFVL